MFEKFRKMLAQFILRGIDIDYAKKCEVCFERHEWTTADGRCLCERHFRKEVKNDR